MTAPPSASTSAARCPGHLRPAAGISRSPLGSQLIAIAAAEMSAAPVATAIDAMANAEEQQVLIAALYSAADVVDSSIPRAPIAGAEALLGGSAAQLWAGAVVAVAGGCRAGSWRAMSMQATCMTKCLQDATALGSVESTAPVPKFPISNQSM